MLKLPKNNQDDEEFIKKAHQDPDWPEKLDKPVDWDHVSLWRKIWFRVRNSVKMFATITVILALVVACQETFFDGETLLEEPHCEQSSKGCLEY